MSDPEEIPEDIPIWMLEAFAREIRSSKPKSFEDHVIKLLLDLAENGDSNKEGLKSLCGVAFALARLLVTKGVFSDEEFGRAVTVMDAALDQMWGMNRKGE